MNFLDRIVERKVDEIASRKLRRSRADLASGRWQERKPVSLAGALASRDQFHIIAEIKKSSPSAGVIRNSFSPDKLAETYTRNGASAISVLTDEEFFSGSLRHLEEARAVTGLPILRKDFIIDEYQIAEARSAGADAVLLIATILDRHQLTDLHAAAREAGLESLVEMYDAKDLDAIDFDTMRTIGINNRDLRTFTIDINRSRTIAQLLPADVTIVSESGIRTPEHCMALQECGIHSALVGEALMRSGDPGAALKTLLGRIDHAASR